MTPSLFVKPRIALFAATMLILAAACKKTGVVIQDQQATSMSAMMADDAVAATDSILQVHGKFLLFPNGDTIILHGVNVPVFHSGWANDLNAVATAIKNNTLVNAVRMHWYSRKEVPSLGNPPYYTKPNLDLALSKYASKHIYSILTLADLTARGDVTITGFNNFVVPFWTDTSILSILKKHQNHIMLNLANEWGATWAGLTGSQFVSTYGSLIVKLRRAGIKCPIVIDAVDGGANSQFLINNGQALINKDSLRNIVLSVHTYWSTENGAITDCSTDYARKIRALSNSGLPFILGEVSDWAVQGSNGEDHESTVPVSFTCNAAGTPNQYSVNYNAILNEAYKDKIGFMAWTWYQDGLLVRNIYDQDNGTTINTSAHAGSWPTDMMSTTKSYGLKNPKLNNIH